MNLRKVNTLYLLFIFLCSSFSISAQVTANFSANVVSGCTPVVIQFTDLSTGSPTTWNWNFGNGNTSVSQNPSAIYTIPGQYTV
ncbi:MAG TPA: PKD domain-containing protein, partial [Bacteroidia bacterium]